MESHFNLPILSESNIETLIRWSNINIKKSSKILERNQFSMSVISKLFICTLRTYIDEKIIFWLIVFLYYAQH